MYELYIRSWGFIKCWGKLMCRVCTYNYVDIHSQNLEVMKLAHSKLLDEMEGFNTDFRRVRYSDQLCTHIQTFTNPSTHFISSVIYFIELITWDRDQLNAHSPLPRLLGYLVRVWSISTPITSPPHTHGTGHGMVYNVLCLCLCRSVTRQFDWKWVRVHTTLTNRP